MATLNVVFSLAVLLLCGSDADGIPLAEFYPFGRSEGDSTLIPNDDGSSSAIALSLPFPFFAVDHRSLFVSYTAKFLFLISSGYIYTSKA